MSNNSIKEKFTAIDELMKQEFSLKLLFGPMFGCELHLPVDDYFLFINSDTASQSESDDPGLAQGHAVHYALNTLYIPCGISSPNITLRLSKPQHYEDGNIYPIEIHSDKGTEENLLKENQVYTHKHIHFAIKKKESLWSESVRNFNIVTSENENTLTVSSSALSSAKSKISKIILLFLLSGFIISLAVLSIYWFQKAESSQRIPKLNEVLSGAPGVLKIFEEKQQNRVFVLAQQLSEMEWATEALTKLNTKSEIELIWLYKHQKDLTGKLLRDGYPIVHIDYLEPQHPVISLYRNMNSEEQNKFSLLIKKAIPFASDVKIIIKTKDELLQEARQGLDRLHIRYQQIEAHAGYAFIINGKLSDNSLAALNNFIKIYTKKWGDNIVSFSVNLNENWLQNKSYVDDSNGYIFLNSKHWYFPITL